MTAQYRPTILYPYIVLSLSCGALGLIAGCTITLIENHTLSFDVMVGIGVMSMVLGSLQILFGFGSLLAWGWTRILGILISAIWALYGIVFAVLAISDDVLVLMPIGLGIFAVAVSFIYVAFQTTTIAYYNSKRIDV